MSKSLGSRRVVAVTAIAIFAASGLTFTGVEAAVAAVGPWNETSTPASHTNPAPSGIVRTLTGDVTGDGVPDQIAITSGKQIWIGQYTAVGTTDALSWSQWTPPSVSALSLSTLQNNSYVGAGDPLRRLGGGTNEPDPIVRDGLTIIVPSTETGTGQAEYWYFHSFGTGFEAPDKTATGAYLADKVMTGDFNGDGRMDFLLIDNTADTWKVVAGGVNTTTGRQQYQSVATWLNGYGLGDVEVVGDFFGTGTDAVAQLSGGTWRVAEGSPTVGENSFSYATWMTGASVPSQVLAADVTGTGYDSLVTIDNATNTWKVLVSGMPSGTPAFTSYTQSVASGAGDFRFASDWNGDGLTDVELVSGGVPKVVVSSYNATTGVPTLSLQSSSLSLGTVTAAYSTYYDINDSADLYLQTASGGYFVTADTTDLSSTRVVHLNRPIRGPANTTCSSGTASNFCGFYSDRIQFFMPHRSPYYVQSIDFDRDWEGYTARAIGDSCFYVYPKRYTVGATDDTTTQPNREEDCDTVEKGAGDPANDAGPVTFPGNGLLVPGTSDGRVEVQGSVYTTPNPPVGRVILRFVMVVNKAGTSPSNLAWVLRLPEADVAQTIGAGTSSTPNTVVLDQVPYGPPASANHTEWGNTGTCNQYVTGIAFYNSFDQSVSHTEAKFELYVKHPSGVVDWYTMSPVEYKGDNGTSSGSYTSRNSVYYATPITIAPGDIVGERTTHYNYGSDSYNADSAMYLLMQKATDVGCSP